MQMMASRDLPTNYRPLYTEIVNLSPELEEDEEQQFLKANQSVIPIFEVDVQSIAERYSHLPEERTPPTTFTDHTKPDYNIETLDEQLRQAEFKAEQNYGSACSGGQS